MEKNTTSVLLVDDDELITSSLARMLKRKQFDVSRCPDPVMALRFCDTMQFDLIITDQRMPVMNGTDFAGLAKQKQPRARVILISGYSDEERVADALSYGVVHVYVRKPWDNEELLGIILEQVEISAEAKLEEALRKESSFYLK